MCPVFRIHSVLDELSYTKGKVDKNSRSGKGNLIAACIFPTSQNYYRKCLYFSSDGCFVMCCFID